MMVRNKPRLLHSALRPAALALAGALAGREAPPADRLRRADAALSGGAHDLSEPLGRAAALIDRIEVVPSARARDLLLERLGTPGGPARIGFVNAHAVNLAWRDRAAAEAFLDLDLLLRDGVGVRIAMRRLSRDPGLNMNGTDLIPRILAALRGRPLALYGTRDPWLGEAARRLARDGHRIADVHHGFDPAGAYAERAGASGAEVVLLAMGMPKQETVARHLAEAGPDRIVLCGGAIADFIAGRQRRAPEWMRASGLEWAFRLLSEPRRLFGRYVIGNAAFLLRTSVLPGSAGARAARRLIDRSGPISRDGPRHPRTGK